MAALIPARNQVGLPRIENASFPPVYGTGRRFGEFPVAVNGATTGAGPFGDVLDLGAGQMQPANLLALLGEAFVACSGRSLDALVGALVGDLRGVGKRSSLPGSEVPGSSCAVSSGVAAFFNSVRLVSRKFSSTWVRL